MYESHEADDLQIRLQRMVVTLTERGASLEEVLHALRQESSSPLESIKAIRALTGISLRQAKDMIDQSRTWEDIGPRVEHAHRLLADDLEREGKLVRQGDTWLLRINLDYE
jgi:DNA-binding transcriptional MerR regulator